MAYPGCCIYRMKWLTRSQIAHSRKSLHETPCAHKPSVFSSRSASLWVSWQEFLAWLRLRPFPPLEPGPNYSGLAGGAGGWSSASATSILSVVSEFLLQVIYFMCPGGTIRLFRLPGIWCEPEAESK